ncbi:MAG: hypothetical protein ACSLE0_20025 [Chitinophagaceae bacterium]
MLEQISNLVKEYGNEVVVKNPAIPNEENNAVLAEATNTITGGLQNMLSGGGLQDIISMFTGKNSKNKDDSLTNGIGGLLKNPMVTMMVGHLIKKLIGKYKINPSQASQISNNLIPNVLNGLISKTRSNDPGDDAFDLNDLVGMLSGNKNTEGSVPGGFNFQELLNGFTRGGDNNQDIPDFNLQDIIGQVTHKAQQNQQQQSGSGKSLSDLIKGFFN